MITEQEILSLLKDVENDRVERTISTTNTDKFGQAICAFANDLPNHRCPGYLFIGVNDDGSIHPIDITDELLQSIAAIRTDGNIQPQPSMVVEKVSLPDGDIIVVEAQPHVFPPVRYKGRVWVRVGPRKGVANEADERLLMEKRRANITSFDAEPCLDASLEDLDVNLFKHYFLPKALSEEDIENDKRDIKYQLSAFGFYDTHYDCPTNAGALFFAKNLRRLIPGAYIQYVHFTGNDKTTDVISEHEFKGNLCTVLPELEVFIKTSIANQRPVPVSALREEMVSDYPDWATRELLMNAICHRDYTSHGPIQLYQYADFIEIENHGGLYGRANIENFPNVNDYRNVVVAEAMKVLGFVNRQSRGVLRVQKDLQSNENGPAVFDFGYQTAVLVRENKSPRGERLMQEAVKSGFLLPNGGKSPQMAENPPVNGGKSPQMTENHPMNDGKSPQMTENHPMNDGKSPQMTENNFPTQVIKDVYNALKQNRKIKYEQLQDNLGISDSTVSRSLKWLKDNGYLPQQHAKVNNEWQLLK